MERATAEIGDADDLSASPMVGVEESVISEERKVIPSGEAASAADEEEEDSSSVEESSEEESSSDDDDGDGDDDDVDGANDGQSNSGLSEYELLRLKRIERNKARLAELGLAGGSIARKSGHGKKRAKKERAEEDLVATRSQPKRAKKSALTQEQLHGPSIARYKRKDDRPRAPKKEKYVPGTCYGCKKEDDEERIYCAYCRYQWHPDCHEPKIVLPLAEGTLFRCNNCEGKPKRLACGFCEPCNRTEDCGGCTYCVEKTQSGAKKKKCVYRRCLVMFNIQPQVPGTKVSPLHQAARDKVEGPEPGDRIEGHDKEGHDTSVISTVVVAAAAAGPDDGPANKPNGPIDSAAKKQADMDTSHHEDRCFACRDGGVLVCCDHCDRVWHPACHKPMVLNVYSKLHCMECKQEEREAAIELRRKQDKERRNQRRLAAGALAGIVDDELVFVNVIGPSPSCAICGIQRHKFKPIPLPPAKRVLYASVDLPEEEESESSDEEFDEEKDGIPLTTNVPKDVEVLNARSMRKVIKTFSSCSEAAREMDVDRSKLSRLCRKGGGSIGVYHFRYALRDNEGGTEIVTGRKRKRKKKKKKAKRIQKKTIECVVKWPRYTFEEATTKKEAAAVSLATSKEQAKEQKEAKKTAVGPVASTTGVVSGVSKVIRAADRAESATPGAPIRAASLIDGPKATIAARSPSVTQSSPASMPLPTDTSKGRGTPHQSNRRTATGKPACAHADCPKQSQGRHFNYMCLVHFKQNTGEKSINPAPSHNSTPTAATPSLTPSSASLSTTSAKSSVEFTFPGSGIPQQSDRLTETGKPACAYADCPKQSQGRRLNFMCMSHFKSITGGKMVEASNGGDSAAGDDWVCDNCGLSVPASLSRCKCYHWRDGIHPMSKKKKKLQREEAKNVGASKASVGAGKADDDEDDTTDWVCDNCGLTVPGNLSRCKCYRWRNGIHPMSKKKNKLKREQAKESSQKDPESPDGDTRIAEKLKCVVEAPSLPREAAVEVSNALVGGKEAEDIQFAYEPLLDATVFDSDGDDVPIQVTVKWPHENPDVRRSDDMIYCNTCGEWYHLHCVSPPILHRDKGGPRGSYKCQACISTGRIRAYKTFSSTKRPSTSVAVDTANTPGTSTGSSAVSGTTSSSTAATGAGPRMRKSKCGQCEACNRPDCGECPNCLDKKKFGGPHRHRQRCEKKACTNPQYRPLLSFATSTIGAPIPMTPLPAPPLTSSAGLPTRIDEDGANEATRGNASVSGSAIGAVSVNADLLLFDEVNGRESHRYEMQWIGGKMRRVMKCRIDGCTKNSRGKKYDGCCLSHFNEAYPNIAISGTVHVKLCKVVGCTRNSRGDGNKYQGCCCLHYNESLRGIVHEIKEKNERVQRPKKKMGAHEKFVGTAGILRQDFISSISRSPEDGCDIMHSKAPRETDIAAVMDSEPAKTKKRLHLEDAEIPSDGIQEKLNAKKSRGTASTCSKEDDNIDEDANPVDVDVSKEVDIAVDDDGNDDASAGPKRKKTRIKISVGQAEAEEGEQERPSRSKKEKKVAGKAQKSNAKPAPAAKKQALSLRIKKKEKDLDPISKKILKIVKTAEKYPDDAKKQDQVCEALRKYANDLDTAAKVIDLGGLEVIAVAMRMHQEVPMVQAEAIGTIADLVWIDAEHGERVAEYGLIDLIASAMERHGTHPKINKLGCGFFRTCSYERGNADLTKKDGISAVITSMKRNPRKSDVLKEGSAFLQNMLVLYPELARTIIKRQGGESEDDGIVPILVNALKNNNKDAKLHEAVCGVLANVALVGTGKSAVSKAGAIPELMKVLKNAALINGEVGLKQRILSFLAFLAADDEANVEVMLQSDDGLKDTLSIIKQHPKDPLLLVAAFDFLKVVAGQNQDVAADIVRGGVVKFVVSAMDKQASFDQLQIAACALLAVVKHEGSKTSIAAAKRVIDAIEYHEDDPNVLEEACHALYNLAASASARNVLPLLKTKNVRESLTKVKEDHPEECAEIVDELFKIASLRSSRRS